jgi:hypothetical protein
MSDHHRLTRTPDGRWRESAPKHCPNGHRLVGGAVLVGSTVCRCSVHHHRTHRCLMCEAITYSPPRGDACEDSSFDGRARS